MNEIEIESIHDATQINDAYLRQLLAPYIEPDQLENIHVKSRKSVSGTRYYLVYGSPDPAREHACPKIQAGDTVSDLLNKLEISMQQASVRPTKKHTASSAVFPSGEVEEMLLLQTAGGLAEPFLAQYFAYVHKKNSKGKWRHYLYLDTSKSSKKRAVLIDKHLRRAELEGKISILFKENHFLNQTDMTDLLWSLYQSYLNIFEPFGFTLNKVFCDLKKAENKGIIVTHGFQLIENQERCCGIHELKTYQFISEDFLLYPSRDQFRIDILDHKKVHSKIQAGVFELSRKIPEIQAQYKAWMSQVRDGLKKYQDTYPDFLELQNRTFEIGQLLAFCQSDACIFSYDDFIPYLKVPGYDDAVYDNAILFNLAGVVKHCAASVWKELTLEIKNDRIFKQCREMRFLAACNLSGNNTEKNYTVQIECLGASQKLSVSIPRKGLYFEENWAADIPAQVLNYLLFVRNHAKNIFEKNQQIHYIASNKILFDMIIAIDRTNRTVFENITSASTAILKFSDSALRMSFRILTTTI